MKGGAKKGADRLQDIGSAIKGIEGTADLSKTALAGFTKIDNSIGRLEAIDLSGAFKEINGIEILTESGKAFDHIGKVEGALTGLKNGIQQLKKALGDNTLSKEARSRIQAKLGATSRLRDDLQRFLDKARKMNQGN
ncbi:hypothetical protein GWO13_08170 [Candidatus Bathyarchaeota archaeon]|nr:hypothetical protein [Candidatus Bathyarchaeota archaeon]